MKCLLSVRAAVIALNKIVTESDLAVFVAPDQTRIIRASSDHGKLCVLGMFTHKWIKLSSDQTLGVWRGPRCVGIYRWTASNCVERDV